MGVVTRRTGLRSEVIRAWERRHRAVTPQRSSGNRRLYSDDDIERLILMRTAVRAGWPIGQVAPMSDAEIQELIDSQPVELEQPFAVRGPEDRVGHHLERCLDRIAALDGDGLLAQIETASVELPRAELLERVVGPLMDAVGEGCTNGRLRVANEHLASAVLRTFLDSLRGAYAASEAAPGILVTTPASQHHELAALLVAATARSEGWRTIYLGPNLPAEEIVRAAQERGCRVLALSLCFPPSSAEVEAELRKLGRLLPPRLELIVGGRAAESYESVLREIGAVHLRDLSSLRTYLGRGHVAVRDAPDREPS